MGFGVKMEITNPGAKITATYHRNTFVGALRDVHFSQSELCGRMRNRKVGETNNARKGTT